MADKSWLDNLLSSFKETKNPEEAEEVIKKIFAQGPPMPEALVPASEEEVAPKNKAVGHPDLWLSREGASAPDIPDIPDEAPGDAGGRGVMGEPSSGNVSAEDLRQKILKQLLNPPKAKQSYLQEMFGDKNGNVMQDILSSIGSSAGAKGNIWDKLGKFNGDMGARTDGRTKGQAGKGDRELERKMKAMKLLDSASEKDRKKGLDQLNRSIKESKLKQANELHPLKVANVKARTAKSLRKGLGEKRQTIPFSSTDGLSSKEIVAMLAERDGVDRTGKRDLAKKVLKKMKADGEADTPEYKKLMWALRQR